MLGLSLVSFVVSGAVAEGFDFSKCGGEDADVGKCARKMDEVVEVTSGVSYLTKIACKDCPYAETWNEDSDDGKPESRMTHGDQELVSSIPRRLPLQARLTGTQFFNVTLANDTRSVLLNGKKIFPTLATIPSPPHRKPSRTTTLLPIRLPTPDKRTREARRTSRSSRRSMAPRFPELSHTDGLAATGS